MDIKLIELVNELIDELNNSDEIKRINILKQEIYNDRELASLLKKYKVKINDEYNSEYIDLKRQIIDNPKIKEFRVLESKLNIMIKEINKRLTKLTEEKSCRL